METEVALQSIAATEEFHEATAFRAALQDHEGGIQVGEALAKRVKLARLAAK